MDAVTNHTGKEQNKVTVHTQAATKHVTQTASFYQFFLITFPQKGI